jgi:hypothetical protein
MRAAHQSSVQCRQRRRQQVRLSVNADAAVTFKKEK